VSVVTQAWEVIHREGRSEAGWHVRRIHPDASCVILAGVQQPGETPGLLLELPVGEIPGGLSLPQSRGFIIQPSPLTGSQAGSARFALTLLDPAFSAVFAVLCEDAAATAAAEARPRSALRSWIGRLHVWQEFMARYGAAGLSEEAALGLYGELWFLREHLAPILGLDVAVDAWAGPLGEPNDFALAGGFVEVKSSARQAPDVLEITSPEQLDQTRGQILLGVLYLHHLPGAETLAQLVTNVRSDLANVAADRLRRFNDLLLAAGYVDAPGPHHDQPWRVQRVDIFRVTGAFPRIPRSELRLGIRTCRYSIELQSCAPYIVTLDALKAVAEGNTLG